MSMDKGSVNIVSEGINITAKKSVVMKNGKLSIDGSEAIDLSKLPKIDISVDGDVGSIKMSHGKITVIGNIGGDVEVGVGDIWCTNVAGKAKTGVGNITIR